MTTMSCDDALLLLADDDDDSKRRLASPVYSLAYPRLLNRSVTLALDVFDENMTTCIDNSCEFHEPPTMHRVG